MTTLPLREKDITLTTILIDKGAKSSPSEVVEDSVSICSSNENNSLKSTILDLNQQLDRFRDVERNVRSEMITQQLKFEKQIAAEKEETKKAYGDYSAEVEDNKRLRKQVEDLLMTDSLNVGLMQQNLMFRERFEMMQDSERL